MKENEPGASDAVLSARIIQLAVQSIEPAVEQLQSERDETLTRDEIRKVSNEAAFAEAERCLGRPMSASEIRLVKYAGEDPGALLR